MAVIISIMSLKGGVAKTTTAISLASFYSRKGNRVLLLDFDAKATLTHSLIDDSSTSFTAGLYDAVLESGNLPVISLRENLYLAPGNMTSAELDRYERARVMKGMQSMSDRNFSQYDLVIIDTPAYPAATFHSALTLSDRILCPVKADYASVSALESMMAMLGDSADTDVLLVQHDTRERHTVNVERELRERFAGRVMEATVRRNVALSECMAARMPIDEYRPESAGAADYAAVAEELFERVTEAYSEKESTDN